MLSFPGVPSPAPPAPEGLSAGAGLSRGHVAVPGARILRGLCDGDSLGVTQAGRELALQCEPELNIIPACGAGRLWQGEGGWCKEGGGRETRAGWICGLAMLAVGKARLAMELPVGWAARRGSRRL